MSDIRQHEYALLNEIARDSMVTQANLSNRLGIAVGSVDWYIKSLIHRGWVKVSHLNRTRLKYDLTPDGMAVFMQPALFYARDSLKYLISEILVFCARIFEPPSTRRAPRKPFKNLRALCGLRGEPFWFRLVRVRVYGNLRNKAKALVGELKQKGIKQAHLEGNDEVTDILRLTCIEAGIRMNDKPDGVTWMVEGRNYRLISTVNEPAD